MQIFRPLRPESEHMLHMDALRLVASVGIVFLHFCKRVDSQWWAANVVPHVEPLQLCVDLFFVISGFVIAFVYGDRLNLLSEYGIFLQRRAARLLPLHWLLLAVFCVFWVGMSLGYIHINHEGSFTWPCFWANLFVVHATGICRDISFNGPSWSISAEFCMYVVAPIVILLTRWSRTVMALAIVAGFFVIVLTPADNPFLFKTAPWGVVRAVPSFILGVLLFQCRDKLPAIPRPGMLIAVLLTLFAALSFADLPRQVFLPIMYAVAALSVIADREKHASPFIRTLAAGGQLTYSSYMLHELLLTLMVVAISERFFHLSGTALNLAIIASFAAVWPISYLSLSLFERPTRNWMSSLHVSQNTEWSRCARMPWHHVLDADGHLVHDVSVMWRRVAGKVEYRPLTKTERDAEMEDWYAAQW